jgi:NDP-sugar pyrophosphorylase family protein
MINLHHLGEKIEAELGDGRTLGVNITYSEEPDILGTGGGIKKMAEDAGNEDFWVVNSDILSDIDLTTITREHKVKSAKATMVLRPHPILLGESHRPTALFINTESRIIGTANAQEALERLDETPFMFTGIHLINPSLLKYLPDGFSCIFKDAYRPAIDKGDEIFGVVYDGYWRDLGTMEAYERADRELSEGRVKLSNI